MAVSTSELIALQRSTAMLAPGQMQPVDRETLYDICSELIEARNLLDRLGADLRTVSDRELN